MHPDIRSRTIDVGPVELHVLEAGHDGPLVVLAHGFPELAYSWRHQLPALAAAGYRVVAPDQRGYGASSCPDAVQDYDIMALTGDLLALIDHYGEDEAVFVGHDWGAIVCWQLALLAPDRVRGVVGLSVPFTPRSQQPPTVRLRELFGDSFFYILHFQEPGVADAELDADPDTTMRRIMCGRRAEGDDASSMIAPDDGRGFLDRMADPGALPAWISEAELAHYVDAFSHTGFTGALSWYRNFDRNWELTSHLADVVVTVPSAFIAGGADPVLAMTPPDRQLGFLTDHRESTTIPGVGHWVQQEAPREVNRALLDFLGGLA